MATRSTPATASTSPSYVGPFITVAILFFIFGFITNLNMALVPHLRNIFDLPYALVSGRHLTWYGPTLVEAGAVLRAQLAVRCDA